MYKKLVIYRWVFWICMLGFTFACDMALVQSPVDPTPRTPVPSAADVPTLTPYPTAGDFLTYTVQATSLNVRVGPGTSFEVISQLSFMDSIVANCQVEGIIGWCAIESQYVQRGDLCPNRLCWVYAACLGLGGECEETK